MLYLFVLFLTSYLTNLIITYSLIFIKNFLKKT
nr:MAG TPA: hypothetical protein [Caudoviricetes sp.]